MLYRIILLCLVTIFFAFKSFSQNENIGIGTTNPDSSAILEIQSTNQGLLIPRMTNAQIEAIAGPAKGLQVYSTDDDCVHFYDGFRWLIDCAHNFSGSSTLPEVGEDWSDFGLFGQQKSVNPFLLSLMESPM